MAKRKLTKSAPHQLNILFPIEGGRRDSASGRVLERQVPEIDEEEIRKRIFDNLKLTGLIRSSK